jgi:prepilin-type N-terminal cleavage/methylation domain-containing protein
MRADRCQGFSLVEVVVAVSLAAVLATTMLPWFVDTWMQYRRHLLALESEAAWENIDRLLREDAHASTRATVDVGAFRLLLADGTSYSYLVNAQGQLVRVRLGGGTTVVADEVARMDVHTESGGFSLTVRMADGTSHTLRVCTLGGMMS